MWLASMSFEAENKKCFSMKREAWCSQFMQRHNKPYLDCIMSNISLSPHHETHPPTAGDTDGADTASHPPGLRIPVEGFLQTHVRRRQDGTLIPPS